jgi:hypothetical protein
LTGIKEGCCQRKPRFSVEEEKTIGKELKRDKPPTGGEPLHERLFLMPYNAKALYRNFSVERLPLEATMGIEPLIRVLQFCTVVSALGNCL